MEYFRPEHLSTSLVGIGVADGADLFGVLSAAYSEPGRYYHTQKHIDECLAHFGPVRGLAEHPCEVDIAIWFHDAVYDTHRDDNEEMSAAWAKVFLDGKGADEDVVQRIVEMILATRAHGDAQGDTALVVDVDLGILGAPIDAFETYDAAIGREYAWVPQAQYREGRARVLQAFLDRPHIYHTQWFRDRYEAQARDNLLRKLAELTAS